MGYLEANRSNTLVQSGNGRGRRARSVRMFTCKLIFCSHSEYDHIPNLVPVVQTTYSGFPIKLSENKSMLGKLRFYSSFVTQKREKTSVHNRSHFTAVLQKNKRKGAKRVYTDQLTFQSRENANSSLKTETIIY